MNKQFGRLLLAGVCGLAVASAAGGADDSPRPSHRLLLDTDFGDLSQAESLLARRLQHTQDFQKFQNLIKDKGFQKLLKGVTPEEIKNVQDAIKNNPGLLDSDMMRGLLDDAVKFKQNGGADLSPDMKVKLAQQVTDLINKHESQDSSSGNPMTSGSPSAPHPALDPPHIPEAPPVVAKPDAAHRDFVQNAADLLKDFDQSAEGEALRKAVLNDLPKPNAGPSSASSDMSDFLQNIISPRQAAWLSHNLKLPSLPKFDGWSSNPSLSAGSSIGGASSGGGLDAVVWVIALALFGVAAVLALRAASRQAAGARAKAWSAGPWPVHPSRVSTREDLIRAFEHLAFLYLGPTARHLNHLDVAGRLGETAGDRAGPAARLAHLYEQARYAPADELLPADELTAARGDLSTLAGAAA